MGNKASLMLQDEEIRQIGEETGFSQQQIEKLYSRFTQLDRNNCGSLGKNDLLSIPELAINPLCDRLIEMFFSGEVVKAHHHHQRPTAKGHFLQEQEERINFRQFMRVLAAFRTNNNNTAYSQVTNQPEQILPNQSNGSEAAQTQTPRPSSRSQLMPTARQTGQTVLQTRNGNNSLVDSLGDCLRDKLYFVFKIYDVDNDGRISFNDLRSILKLMVGNYIEEVQLDKIATRAFLELDRDNDGFVEFGEFCKVFAGKDLDDKLRVKFF